jgi:hypothetical protein
VRGGALLLLFVLHPLLLFVLLFVLHPLQVLGTRCQDGNLKLLPPSDSGEGLVRVASRAPASVHFQQHRATPVTCCPNAVLCFSQYPSCAMLHCPMPRCVVHLSAC